METIELINGLSDAAKLIRTTRQTNLDELSDPVWRILNHAEGHLNQQITVLLAPDPEPVAPLDLNARLRASIKAEDWRDRETCPACHEYNVNCTCDDTDEPQPQGQTFDESDVERMAE